MALGHERSRTSAAHRSGSRGESPGFGRGPACLCCRTAQRTCVRSIFNRAGISSRSRPPNSRGATVRTRRYAPCPAQGRSAGLARGSWAVLKLDGHNPRIRQAHAWTHARATRDTLSITGDISPFSMVSRATVAIVSRNARRLWQTYLTGDALVRIPVLKHEGGSVVKLATASALGRPQALRGNKAASRLWLRTGGAAYHPHP